MMQGLLKRPVRTSAAVATGAIALVFCALQFVYLVEKMLIDFDDIFLLFILGVTAAGAGSVLLYRSIPRTSPASLFGGSGRGFVRPAMRTETRAAAEAPQLPGAPNVHASPGKAEAFVRKKDIQPLRVSNYKAREGIGFLGIVALIGMGLALLGCELHVVRDFLALSIFFGGMIAVARYAANLESDSLVGMRAGAGTIGVVAMIGIAVAMARYPFLRDFLGLALGGGCAIALLLRRLHRRSAITSVT